MITRLHALLFLLMVNTLAVYHVSADEQSIDPRLRQVLTEAINSSESFDDRFHAEVWLLDMSNRLKRYVKDEKTRLAMLKHIHLEATRSKLQPELVLAPRSRLAAAKRSMTPQVSLTSSSVWVWSTCSSGSSSS